MSCVANAADPGRAGRILTCENPSETHDGQHHAHTLDQQLVRWGSPNARRQPPGPDPDFFEAYLHGDEVAIAAARGRYSTKLQEAGFPGLTDPIDWAADR